MRVFQERPWRRITLALPISLLLHLVVAVFMRPDYKPVSDYAVDLDVVEVKPGPPPSETPSEQAEPAEPQPAEPAVEEQKPLTPAPPPKPEPGESAAAQKEAKTKPTLVAMNRPGEGPVDAGAQDGGVGLPNEIGALASREDGGAPGTGICMHDLFPFSEPDPSWMLWISLKSFRETAIQDEIGNTLLAYSLGSDISKNTGIDARRGAEGLLVTAGDIFDLKSYRVAVSYDSGEGAVRKKLEGVGEGVKVGKWRAAPPGYEALSKNGKEWHLGASGRVMVVTGESSERIFQGDAGVAPEPRLETPGQPDKWPANVGCLTLKTLETKRLKDAPGADGDKLASAARAYLAPDGDGHWPVALFATSDPRAVGLRANRKNRSLRFISATARVYFTTPVRLQGEVRFAGPQEKIAAIAEQWRKIAAATSGDPFLAMAGLGRIFDKLEFTASENRIEFSLELTEGQIRAALIFFQLQGSALERQLKD